MSAYRHLLGFHQYIYVVNLNNMIKVSTLVLFVDQPLIFRISTVDWGLVFYFYFTFCFHGFMLK